MRNQKGEVSWILVAMIIGVIAFIALAVQQCSKKLEQSMVVTPMQKCAKICGAQDAIFDAKTEQCLCQSPKTPAPEATASKPVTDKK